MLTIDKIYKMKPGGKMVVCPVVLYQTSDGRIVGADDPDRRWKYCGVGQEILESVLAEFQSGGTAEKQKAKPRKKAQPKRKESKVNQQAETKEASPETKEAKPRKKKRPREGQQE